MSIIAQIHAWWRAWRPREAARSRILRRCLAGPLRAISVSAASGPATVPPAGDGESDFANDARWFIIDFPDGIPAGRWIALHYRTSFFDPVRRPVLRITTPDDSLEKLLPAALFGTDTWVGYIPADAQQISISPALRQGTSGFEVAAVHALSPFALASLGILSADILRIYFAVCLWCLGKRSRARHELEGAIGTTPLEHYHEWRERHVRPLEPEGLDAPTFDWKVGPHICLVAYARTEQATEGALDMIGSLHLQVYPNWSIAIVTPRGELPALPHKVGSNIAHRVISLRCGQAAIELHDALPAGAIIAPVLLGDALPDYTLAVLAEYFSHQRTEEIAYADEESRDGTGRFCSPALKPDWSPIFQQASSYAAGAVNFRLSLLKKMSGLLLEDLAPPNNLSKILLHGSVKNIGHIRRVTLTKSGVDKPKVPLRPSTAAGTGMPTMARSAGPCATIIIPSKDKAKLLQSCLSSIERTEPSNFEVIIIDNGSVEAKTWELYETLKADPRIHIVTAPGPFNYPKLCNQAASLSKSSILVFLNNDTVAPQRDWLSALIQWAERPDVGAVGAKLIYPSGRLQHGGVVLGIGGYAGHIDVGTVPSYAGYLGCLAAPHEVSAVTAACLAIEKRKFDAVGGFDEINYPVDLNDVDLCLRLAESGWKTIFIPECTLVHLESATRGRTLFRPDRYPFEKANFSKQWKAQLRDDPYFHPALSLQTSDISLA